MLWVYGHYKFLTLPLFTTLNNYEYTALINVGIKLETLYNLLRVAGWIHTRLYIYVTRSGKMSRKLHFDKR